MKSNWTTSDILRLEKEGKIRGHNLVIKQNNPAKIGGRIVTTFRASGHKEKDSILFNLLEVLNCRGLILEEEYRFCERKWRFDWANEKFKIAIEYEGLNSKKSGHTTLKGYSKDTEKYNRAIAEGWTLFRYTALNYQNCKQDLENYLNEKL